MPRALLIAGRPPAGQALAHEPVAVLVLGGDHDLAASAEALGRGRCAYVQVTVCAE